MAPSYKALEQNEKKGGGQTQISSSIVGKNSGRLSRKGVLKKILREFSRYLEERFGKGVDYYKSKLLEIRGNLFYVVSQIEKVDETEVYNKFKQIVERIFNDYGFDRFLFFKEDIAESRIKEWEEEGYKVIEEGFIPFSFFRKDITEEHLRNAILVINREKGRRAGDIDKSLNIEEGEEESLGARVFRDIIFSAVVKKASDVHIVPSSTSYNVFFRIDGFFVMQPELVLPEKKGDALLTYLLRRASREVRGQFNPDTRIVYQDARISVPEVMDNFGIPLDIRIAFVPDGVTLSKMDVCIRMLYKKRKKSEHDLDLDSILKSLGYLEEDVEVLKSITYRKNGIVVVSGITNSGKSTLVSTLLSCIRDKKIGTIEDPIEYFVDNPNYVQHQLFISEKEKLSMDFEDYVKAFKRSDYDIVFVGEWRKHKGLTEAMLEQAYAGQLIFTTLHIGNSFQIFDATKTVFGVNPDELKPVLLLSWNQVLIPKLCEKCKKRVKKRKINKKIFSIIKNSTFLTEEMLEKIRNFEAEECFVKGEGCKECGGLGYKGRQVIYDYFVPTYDLWEKIGNNYSPYSILKNATKKKTKIDVFLEYVLRGNVSIDDIYMVI